MREQYFTYHGGVSTIQGHSSLFAQHLLQVNLKTKVKEVKELSKDVINVTKP